MILNRIHVVTNWTLTAVLLFAFGLSGYQLHHKHKQEAALPKTILVGKDVWTVYQTPELLDGTGFLGETDCRNHIILYMRIPQESPQISILHELLHAGACKGNLPDNHYWNSEDDATHGGIYRISTFEAEILRDNPQLAEWLKRKD